MRFKLWKPKWRPSARTHGVARSEMQAALKADAEKLEAIQQGAGEVGRRVSALRQQLQEREGLKGNGSGNSRRRLPRSRRTAT